MGAAGSKRIAESIHDRDSEKHSRGIWSYRFRSVVEKEARGSFRGWWHTNSGDPPSYRAPGAFRGRHCIPDPILAGPSGHCESIGRTWSRACERKFLDHAEFEAILNAISCVEPRSLSDSKRQASEGRQVPGHFSSHRFQRPESWPAIVSCALPTVSPDLPGAPCYSHEKD